MSTAETWRRWVWHALGCSARCVGVQECGGCPCHTTREEEGRE